ncbi:MAG: heavy-metal-associated domain-containing protein [Chitinophagales bacterium]|nr:heavy-metal-associated domain-containing protein [Chitinophagales bacterium]
MRLTKTIILLFVLLLNNTAKAQSKVATISIKTSIYCDHCKRCESCGKRLEEAVYKQKGIKRVDIDEKTKTVSVIYNTSKTTPEKLRQAIASVGFDADDIKGDPKAYTTWDDCCKK